MSDLDDERDRVALEHLFFFGGGEGALELGVFL